MDSMTKAAGRRRCDVAFYLWTWSGWLWLLTEGSAIAAGPTAIYLEATAPGRTFEGIGALSAGASSKLLVDYAEPHRSQVLDLLFKPKFGASLQHLKVEIGGDINSTDGTEPAWAHTRAEFEKPRREYFLRGYETWLMQEARQRQPQLILESLQWGAPYWIGNGQFWSQDNADYLATFHEILRREFKLPIGFQGLWNETAFDTEWIKTLRRTLDARGLTEVKIIAADQEAQRPWTIIPEIYQDPALSNAIAVVGDHYLGYSSPPEARALNKPLWAAEDGPWAGDWQGATRLAKLYNRSYIEGRLTKVVTWALVSSYYDILPLPGSGLMRANTPWSGGYEVQPALWAAAHHTQFAAPGWRYLDPGCTNLPSWGSCVTYLSPDGQDLTLVVETVDSPYTNRWMGYQDITFHFGEGIPRKPMHIWQTSSREWFAFLGTAEPQEGKLRMKFIGDSIYTLSTTTGQKKGDRELSLPPAKAFPLPYADDFESYAPMRLPRYLIDQAGVFEVAQREDGAGRCLRQMAPQRGIEWRIAKNPWPYTVLGASDWKNYEVSIDVRIGERGGAGVLGHVVEGRPLKGCLFFVEASGRWHFFTGDAKVAEGNLELDPTRWQRLGLRFQDGQMHALLNGKVIQTAGEGSCATGLAGFACSWAPVLFDNLKIERVAPGS